ncbi:MAG: alpha/beta fold hydrolase [Jhaorihella sp.]
MTLRLAAIVVIDMAGYARLMEDGAEDLLARQGTHRAEVIDPALADHGGRVVKTMGDGLLAEFATARAAIACVLAIQTGLAAREAHRPPDRRIQYRAGVSVGDVIDQAGDLFGDCVNLSARLETVSEPGGVCVSETALSMLPPDEQAGFRDMGSQRLKNLSRPVRIWQWTPQPRQEFDALNREADQQRIGFCTATDGVQLAYARLGRGPIVFKAPNWVNHLDYDWKSPISGPGFARIARSCELVRFDQRGNGLSDWAAEDISETAMLADMECVVAAAGLARFALFGQSQGCAFSVRYAATHPEKVACMVLLGGYGRGVLRRGDPAQAELHTATNNMIRVGWGSVNPAYRHMFTESMLPDASPAQKLYMDEQQRLSTTPENAARINAMNAEVDVMDLAARIRAPTLICHAEGDRRIPLDEGRRLAGAIPGAEFVTLPGSNHMLVEGTEAFDVFHDRMDSFVARHAR